MPNTKFISKVFSVIVLSLFATISVFSSVRTFASERQIKDDLSPEEISSLKDIVNTNIVADKKTKISTESQKTKNSNYKDILNNKIVVDISKSDTTVTGNIPSKYENDSKNYACWDGTGNQLATNSYGGWVWRFNLRINACADYSRMYSGSVRSTWADVYTVGWSYYGESPDRRFDYINSNQSEYIASRQGVFKLCVNSNWVCVQESRPWVEYHATRQGYNDYWY
jgi:hypothetical protein